MHKISLYRKYRPQNFDNLIGQEHVRTTLMNAVKQNSVAHAYLFTGPRGTGKTSCARLLAKALNCQNLKDGYEPCDECDFCREITENRLIDLIEIDAASNRGIDEIRDLKEKISFVPTRSKYKVYIIDEVHMLTNEAFNALLKTLEEPPEHAFFILATTEIHKIPATIISRCQRFDFRRINPEDTAQRLKFIAEKEGLTVEDNALLMISNAALGGLRDAIGLMDQLVVDKKLTTQEVGRILGDFESGLMNEFYEGLINNKCKELFELIDKIYRSGNDPLQFIRHFIEFLRGKMHDSLKANDRGLTVKVLNFIEIFQEANLKFYQAIPQLSLELAVVKALEKIEVSAAVIKSGDAKSPSISEINLKPQITKSNVVEKTTEVESNNALSEKEVPAVSAEPRQHANLAPKTPIDGTNIISEWKKIISEIPQPGLRNALKHSSPEELNGIELVLCFGTEFFKDQVMEQGNKGTVESFLKEKTGHDLKLKAIVKKSAMPTPQKEEPVTVPYTPEPVSTASSEKNIADTALDIFGGEMI